MDFISGLSDDQKALAGCFVAFVTCSVVMLLSVYLRKDRGHASQNDELSMERRARDNAGAHAHSSDDQISRRKAA